jgi:DNA-binding transcriptional MerR regulator/effector-binding domain-containing protein
VSAEADPLLPIGRFARGCRLSVKALRHYDELGLLRPATVDRSTGYRYYRRSQVRTAVTIALLRSLGVALPTIQEILAARQPSEVGRALQRERERVDRELARARRALLSIDRMLQLGTPLTTEIVLREEPTRLMLCLDAVTSDDREIADTTALVDRLFELIRDRGIKWTPPVLSVLPEVREDDEFQVRVGIGVETAAGDVAEARLELLRGGPCAVILHRGAYEELALAHHALLAWVQERAFEEAGPLREYYLNDPRQVEVSALETEVVLPVVPPRGGTG